MSQKPSQKANEYLIDRPSTGFTTPEEYTALSPKDRSFLARSNTGKQKRSIFHREKSENRMQFQNFELLRHQFFSKVDARESDKQSDFETQAQKQLFSINQYLPQQSIVPIKTFVTRDSLKKALTSLSGYKDKKCLPKKSLPSVCSPSEIKGIKHLIPKTKGLIRPKTTVKGQAVTAMSSNLKVKQIVSRVIA